MLTTNAVYTDVSLILKSSLQNVAKHAAIIDPTDLELIFQVFSYENYSKNPTILIKKILFDLMQLSVLRLVKLEKLKLNDFHYREETNEDGEVSKFFINENFVTHSRGSRREEHITIKFDDTETCKGIKLLYTNYNLNRYKRKRPKVDASIFDSALSHTRRSDASEKREENSVSSPVSVKT